MPENSSGFVDYSQFSEGNQDEEQRLLEQAMQRAEEADTTAKRSLGRASAEAEKAGLTDPNVSLSSTASYSDYLKAKNDAASAWAAIFRDGSDPRSSALRGQLRAVEGVRGRATGAAGDLSRREDVAGRRVAENTSYNTRLRGEAEARKQAQADAAKARQDETDKAKNAYLTALVRGAGGRAAAGGTQRDYVGGYNPYASSTWAQQQGGWEAQQARNAGASEDQVQNIWAGYVGKGEQGGEGMYRNMEREMAPWAPKKDEEG